MRIWIIILFLSLGTTVSAQEVISKGKVYEVKGKAIFQDDIDITPTLLIEERDHIYKALKNQIKNNKDAEKARKKLVKYTKNAENSQKKSAKALKQKQKAQDEFTKATKKLDQNQAKFEKLKFRGKLSPNDEAKWLKKLEGYKNDLQKATRKLQSS